MGSRLVRVLKTSEEIPEHLRNLLTIWTLHLHFAIRFYILNRANVNNRRG